MKNNILLTLFLISFISLAQKNNNEKVYDKPPAVETVNKFTNAWINEDIMILMKRE